MIKLENQDVAARSSVRQPLDAAARASAEWCFPEIQHAFERVALALDDYRASQQQDQSLFERASISLHQGLGALRVMSPAGIDVFADTLERVFEGKDSVKIEWSDENVVHTKRALAALTEYLEDLISGEVEEPLLLFPHFKAMQMLCGQARLHPAELFQVPQDAKLLPESLEPRLLSDEDKARLRIEYEQGLLKTLRSGVNEQIAGDLRVVLEKVAQSPEGMNHYSFWRAAAAVFQAVSESSLEVDLYVKRLVARLNTQLKDTLAGGKSVSDQLHREVLFSLAMAENCSANVQLVRHAFCLEGSIPDDFEISRFGLFDKDAERQAKDSIPAIKDAWDLVTQSMTGALPRYAEAVGVFHGAASLLGPNLSELSSVWAQVGRAIELKSEVMTEVLAVEMATSVLFVESLFSGPLKRYSDLSERCKEMVGRLKACSAGKSVSEMPEWLATLSREAQERSTMTVFIREAKNGMKVAEEGVDLFLRDLQNTTKLLEASASLSQISGALMLLGQEEPSDAARHLAQRISKLYKADKSPTEEEQQLLASSMGALALFVDSLAQNIDQDFVFDPDTGEFALVASDGDAQDVFEVVLGTSIPEKKKRRSLLRKSGSPPSLAPSLDHTGQVPQAPGPDSSVPQPRVDQSPLVSLEAFEPSQDLASIDASSVATKIGANLAIAATATVTRKPSPEPLSSDDLELRDIFIFEALEVLEAIDEASKGLASNPADGGLMTIIRRGFHTLKGSSRMVSLNAFGEASWGMEQLLNHYLSSSTPADETFISLVVRARAQLLAWTESLQVDPYFELDPSPMVEEALALREGRAYSVGTDAAKSESSISEPLAIPVEARVDIDAIDDSVALIETVVQPDAVYNAVIPSSQSEESVFAFDESDASWLIGDEPTLAVEESNTLNDTHLWLDESALVDEAALVEEPALIEAAAFFEEPALIDESVFLKESDSFAESVLSDDLVIADEAPLFEESAPLDEPALFAEPSGSNEAGKVDEQFAAQAPVGFEPKPLIGDGSALFAGLGLVGVTSAAYAFGSALAAKPQEVVDQVPAPMVGTEVRVGERSMSRQLFQIFVDEASVIVAKLDSDLLDWSQTFRSASELGVRGIHSLKGSSSLVGLDQVTLIAERLEQFMLVTQRESVPAEPSEVSQYSVALEGIKQALDDFAAHREADDQSLGLAMAESLYASCAERAAALNVYEDRVASANVVSEQALAISEALEQDADALASEATRLEVGTPPYVEQHLSGLPSLNQEILLQKQEAFDEDLVPLFVEEAKDYLPQIGENLRSLSANANDKAVQQLVMRQLHTVKGGARMAGAMVLGNRVHDMETRIESAMVQASIPREVIETLVEDYDQVNQLFDALQLKLEAPEPTSKVVDPSSPDSLVETSFAAPADSVALTSTDLSQAGLLAAGLASPVVSTAGANNAVNAQQVNIRVRADLLDRVVNEAGEVAIVRSRTENSMSSLKGSISDLTENVSRLRNQLREIEIQAEIQMQAQIAQAKEAHNFDPLEYDRYTRFQELTRMLAESVNDVATVQTHVNRTIEDAGLDLHRQGQLMRDLQQDLMRMRMIAFGSISERLYRIVRQASKELSKRVNLDVRGSSTELDRNVLERMSAPIEHLLRNSVAHGIESPEERLKLGKSEIGEVVVSVRQDGNEVVLSFKDDGGGLNLARIRAKAIERGLMSENDELSDSRLAEMIFMPGFSTATEVSQISGRGVGMDVVRAEVQSLGGRIDTKTILSQGTEFSIYLPLTLAVTQVVLVKVGDYRFAIPSGSIEQVLQLKAQPLVAAYEAQSVQWMDQQVPMQYFGGLLDMVDVAPVAQHYSPIIIARTGPHRVAVHVDEVIGNQEVVVKNVGAQVARVPGIAGATVLGNGEIVLIINPVAMAQKQDGLMSLQVVGGTTKPVTDHAALIETPTSVLVVDDSLTVRKVTQRLLTREGYDVILAKDGVDALKQLQDRIPDVVISDIEMPRMDGFDLVRNIRADALLTHLPVIMISSRTADKHQSYAKSLGVSAFLGKPYSEETLLGLLADYTAQRREKKINAS